MAKKITSTPGIGGRGGSSSQRGSGRVRTSVVPRDPRVPAASSRVVLKKGTDPFLGLVPESEERYIRRIIESRTPTEEEQTSEAAREIAESPAASAVVGGVSASPSKGTSKRRPSKAEQARAAEAEQRRAERAASVVLEPGVRQRSKAGIAAEEQAALKAYQETPKDPFTTLSVPTPESPITEMDLNLMRVGVNPDAPPNELSAKRAGYGRPLNILVDARKSKEIERQIKATKIPARKELLEERLGRLQRTAVTNRARRVEEGYEVDPQMLDERREKIRELSKAGLVAPNDSQMAGLSADQIREVQKGLVYDKALKGLMEAEEISAQPEDQLDPEPSTRVRNSSDIPRVNPNPLLEEFEVVPPPGKSGERRPTARELYGVQQRSRSAKRAAIELNRSAVEYNSAMARQNRANSATAALAQVRGVEPTALAPTMPLRPVPAGVSGRTFVPRRVTEEEVGELGAARTQVGQPGGPKRIEAVVPAELVLNEEEAFAKPEVESSVIAGTGKVNPGSGRTPSKAPSIYEHTSGSDTVTFQIPEGLDIAAHANRVAASMGMSPSLRQINHLKNLNTTVRNLRSTPVQLVPRARAVAGEYDQGVHTETMRQLESLTQRIQDHDIMGRNNWRGEHSEASRKTLLSMQADQGVLKAKLSGLDALRSQSASAQNEQAKSSPESRIVPVAASRGMGQYGRVSPQRRGVPMAPTSQSMREEAAARASQPKPFFDESRVIGALETGGGAFRKDYMGTEGIRSVRTILANNPSSASRLQGAASRGLAKAMVPALGKAMGVPDPSSRYSEGSISSPAKASEALGQVQSELGRAGHFAQGSAPSSPDWENYLFDMR